MSKSTSIQDCQLIEINQIGDRRGHISVIENNREVPFEVKRVFYLYDIPGGESRGAHAHVECHQLLIAASGGFQVEVNDTKNKHVFSLGRPNQALHVPPGIWASEINFTSGAICLVLASHEYDEQDYLRNYNDFLNFKNA
ncbi:WxcM-like, C-terminal [Psychroflexus salarius]|uniref:WxcM-like, C-terminal n=1 Tax=Psychroflexus salarius TaxID=1155689 RepID=A0A1M4V538_9FLAO|nr:FdtA/QdtA family cupin domain-containing protein [Psychroflexus salarius]SHE64049.1 WxcM-like, C-terminal [Psychroflexus salarius]